MLGFFSKARYRLVAGDGLPKYLRYAIGEIVLITAGILIALEINNWNEERIEQAQVHSYARSLIEDLKADQGMLERVRNQVEWVTDRGVAMSGYLRGKSLGDVDNTVMLAYTRHVTYTPYSWNRTALEQMKASGALRQMRNVDLATRIAAYEALSLHLDEDADNDRRLGGEASVLTHRVVNRNVPDLDAIRDHVSDIPVLEWHEQLGVFKGTENDAPLLAEGIHELHVMANAYITLGDAVRARHLHEIPRLKEMGADLIALLEKEYPE